MLPRLTPPLAAALAATLALAGGCSAPAPEGPRVGMDFTRAGGLYDAPFPSDDLRGAGGRVDLGRFPNPDAVEVMRQATALIGRDAAGFAQAGAVYFTVDRDLGAPALPDATGSLADDAAAFLFDLAGGHREAAVASYTADGGPFGAPHLLALLPYQGAPLPPGRHAAVVRTSLRGDDGRALAPSDAVAALAAGQGLPGLPEAVRVEYQEAIVALAAAGVAPGDIAGLAVFSTDGPEAALARFLDDALARPLPAPATPWHAAEAFDGYCVFTTTIDLPDYQQGTPPYDTRGGDWGVDEAGRPLPPHLERARVVVTVPRAAMPPTGYPTVLFVRTGAGGDRPLVDRGAELAHGGPPLRPGSGPAMEFARVGFAGVQVDGPLGGLRNTSGGDEQFLVFNVFNLAALRDNIRQSALELALLAHVLPTLRIDASGCAGAAPLARLDGGKLALFGHSMGATIAPLAAAVEPAFGAVILSGAGGSYVENVLWKRKPVPVLPIAETLLAYPAAGRSLTAGDPALTLFQWATEPADPQVYARLVLRGRAVGLPPRHLLMEQGIVDNYILPAIANALSVPLGLDLAGAPLDRSAPALAGQPSIVDALALAGRARVALPAAGNLVAAAGASTALVIQHPEDGLEDGHEVIFQTAPPKREYRCLLEAFGAGRLPVIPTAGADDAPCH